MIIFSVIDPVTKVCTDVLADSAKEAFEIAKDRLCFLSGSSVCVFGFDERDNCIKVYFFTVEDEK